ncbi:hypothetical protein BJV77DRAFT_34125 [Russula vinacea]|nr:hypothetical protein BJV77DRAFT_34125 [Russula vinacea]
MTLITRLLVPLALLASILPSVIAGGSDCTPDKFWYDNKSCCVPKTPPSNPSSPPPGKSCPKSNYYWSDDKSCCLPTSPPPSSPPTCENGHSWKDSESCCSPPAPSDCEDDEFWYTSKSCCLPKGGPPNPPNPPTGSGCPSSGWYWYSDQSCCVPHQPNLLLRNAPLGGFGTGISASRSQPLRLLKTLSLLTIMAGSDLKGLVPTSSRSQVLGTSTDSITT